jgi:hypothetical protein
MAFGHSSGLVLAILAEMCKLFFAFLYPACFASGPTVCIKRNTRILVQWSVKTIGTFAYLRCGLHQSEL